jgi:hypothetical protein
MANVFIKSMSSAHLSTRVFPCATPAEVRASLPTNADVVAFQCRNPVHRAHYELFTRALHAPNVRSGAVCLVHPTCGPTQVSKGWWLGVEQGREGGVGCRARMGTRYVGYAQNMAQGECQDVHIQVMPD